MPNGSPRPLLFVLLGTILLTLAVWVAPRPATPSGLVARYYANPEWSGSPISERVEPDVSTATVAATPELAALPALSIEWSGFLVVANAGLHRFATKSDDGSWLWIDERLVIDNGGIHPVVNRSADVLLARGVHAIRVRYMQGGGDHSMQLGQAGGRGRFGPAGPLLPVEMSYWQFRARELWPLAMVTLWYAALGWCVWLLVQRASSFPPLSDLANAARDRMFLIVAVLGVLVSAMHLAYGLPSFHSFSADELPPLATLGGSHTSFRDWNLRWPPLHFNVIVFALRPFEWAESLFRLPLADPAVNAAMFVVVRTVSLAMLFVALLLTFEVSRVLFGRVSGYFAVALLASMPVVAYFGPLANLETPQLCWATIVLWTWVTFVRVPTLGSALAFGLSVGLSLAAKDQLYGFYLAAPVAVLAVMAREAPAGRRIVGMLAAIADRRVITIGVATLAGLALGHQLPMEWGRFIAHVRTTTEASVPFRAFSNTGAGHLGLLLATSKLMVWAAGLPAMCAFVLGAMHLMATGRARLLASLLLPLVTYYLGFLVVILYVYDRFLIAFLPVVAIVGGHGLLAAMRASSLPRFVRVAPAIVVLTCAALGAIGINAVFAQDPRYRAQDWLAQNVACGSSVGVTFTAAYVPPLDCYDIWPLMPDDTERMTRLPDYLVLNEAYANRFRASVTGQRFLARLTSGALGYRLAYRAETSPPSWAPLYWESRFHNAEEDVETTLDKPLHAIEIWAKKENSE